MTEANVLGVLEQLASAEIHVWIGGGWGVDALVGRQTRQHADLDLVFDRSREGHLVRLLVGAGFTETLDWRPGRFVMSRGSQQLDLHPAEFRQDGSAVQHTDDGRRFDYPAADFTAGVIGRAAVPCISATLQLAFHRGYDPAAKDVHDLALLEQLLAD